MDGERSFLGKRAATTTADPTKKVEEVDPKDNQMGVDSAPPQMRWGGKRVLGMGAVRRYLERKGSWLLAAMVRTVTEGFGDNGQLTPGVEVFSLVYRIPPSTYVYLALSTDTLRHLHDCTTRYRRADFNHSKRWCK